MTEYTVYIQGKVYKHFASDSGGYDFNAIFGECKGAIEQGLIHDYNHGESAHIEVKLKTD